MKGKKLYPVMLVLILALAAAALSGCRKSLEEDNKDTGAEAVSMDQMVPEEGASLVFWSGNKEYAEAIAAAFEEEYGIPVTAGQEGYGVVDKIALSGPGGEGADVYMSPHDSFQKGLASGVFMKLSDAVKKEIEGKVTQTGINTVTSNGALYGIPVSIEVNCLFYNKNIVPEPAGTLEEIIAAAGEFNDPGQNRFILLCPIGDGYNEYPFLAAEGYQLFGADGTDGDNPGFDTDAFERGLQLIADMHDIIPINSTDLGNKSSLKSAFMEGQVGYYITGPWDVTQFKESGVNFGITTLPSWQGKALTPFAGLQCAYVSPYTDYPIASQLLAAFLVSEKGAEILYDKYDGITTLSDISKVPGLSEDQYVKAFVEQFAHAVPMPSVTRISFFWSITQDIDKAVFDGQLTPVEGRKKAVENWNALLATE